MQQLIALAFFVVLLFIIVRTVLRWSQIGGLRKTGERVAATVRDMAHKSHTTMNPTTHVMTTRHDWYIEAGRTDPTGGETRVFRSDCLDEWDAERYLVGSPITVLVDPQNPNGYYVKVAY